MYDGSIRIDTRIDQRGFNRGVGVMTQSFKKIGALIATVFSVAVIGQFVKGVVKEFGVLTGNLTAELTQLSAAWAQLRGTLAAAIGTLLTALTPILITVINWLTRLLQIAAKVISVFFGVKVAMGGAAEATKKAAKEAQGALAPFDELNVLQQPQQAEEAESAALPALDDLPGLEEKLLAFKDKMIEFFKPLTDAFWRLVEALKPLGKTLWEGLVWAWDNILVPLGTWVAQDLLPAFLDLLAAAAGVLDSALQALKPAALWFWENFLKPAAQWAGDLLIAALEWITERLKELAKWIDNNQVAFTAIVVVIGVVIAVLLAIANPILAVIALIIALIAVITNWGEIWKWIQIMAAATWEYIKKTWMNAGGWFAVYVGQAILNAITGALNSVKAVWENTLRAVSLFTTTFVMGVSAAFSNVTGNIAASWSNTFSNMTGSVSGFVTNVRGFFAVILGTIRTSWETTFNGVVGFTKGVVNTIIDFVNTMIRAIVGGVNAAISALNRLSVTIPSWIPLIGGNKFGFNIGQVSAPQIPRLATGAVIPPNSEFLAVLGDQRAGRNIEAPEGLIRQIIQEEMGGVEVRANINFVGALAEVARLLKPEIDIETSRVGKSLSSMVTA